MIESKGKVEYEIAKYLHVVAIIDCASNFSGFKLGKPQGK